MHRISIQTQDNAQPATNFNWFPIITIPLCLVQNNSSQSTNNYHTQFCSLFRQHFYHLGILVFIDFQYQSINCHWLLLIIDYHWFISPRNQGHDKWGEIWMSLITCGSIHQGDEWFGDDSWGRRDFYVFGCSITCVWAILPIPEVPIYRSSPTSWDHFFLSVFSSSEVWRKMLPFWVNCRLKLVGFRKQREEGVKPTCFMSKATSVPQTNYSQYSSPVEALSLTVESKCLPVVGNGGTSATLTCAR